MVNYDKKHPLYSIHVVKCGGTSFTQVLKRWFHLGYKPHYFNHEKNSPPDPHYYRLKLNLILPMCIHGHFESSKSIGVFDYYPDAKQFITVLRDPIEAHISGYFYIRQCIAAGTFYIKGRKVEKNLYESVDDFIENERLYYLNFFPWDFQKEDLNTIVNQNFIHIGVSENMQKSVDVMAEKLNKKKIIVPTLNISKKDETPSESSIKIFQEKYKTEHELYELATKLNS